MQYDGSCVQCGQMNALSEMLNYAGLPVCARCKPVFLQGMREGQRAGGSLPYAGFWLRFLAKIIDAVLLYTMQLPLSMAVGRSPFEQPDPELLLRDPWSFWGPSLVVGALGLVLSFAYSVGFVGRFGATPGKLVFGLRVVTPDGKKLGYARALVRALGEWVTGFTCTVGYLIAAFDPEKQSLHDRIAGTRVVSTRSPDVTSQALQCEVCHSGLGEIALRDAGVAHCTCGESYRFVAFPAAFAAPAYGEPAPARQPEQAACYFHPHKLASAACDDCGRLTCSVCALESRGRYRCPSCVARVDGAVRPVEERWMHDSITLLIALVPPLVFLPIVPLTGSYALYRSAHYFREPFAGPLPRKRVRLALAAVISLLELAAVAVVIMLLLRAWGQT